MIRFKNFIKEELNDEEKAQVAEWPRGPKALEATDHFFGKGNDEKHEELAGTVDKSEVHKAVERHLGHEIHPDDYRAGVTYDKYGRKTKIGGMLTKSKADPKLINGFANDNTRQGKKQTGLSVRITRSPEGVAGQTSHNQSWENQSCKNFNTGSNRHYLEHEVKHGTVVAYLHNHKGEEIARATLQPHTNDEGHTAYAVDSHYGIDNAGFKQHVEDLAKRLSGEHKGGSLLYTKHPEVYNDNEKETILHPNATSGNIHDALDDEQEEVRKAAASHPNANKIHINRALNDDDYEVRQAAASNKNATSEHLDKALNDKSGIVRIAAVSNKNATKEHLDKALNDKIGIIRETAASHPNATSEHLNKALNDDDYEVRKAAASNPNASKEHLDKALNDEHFSVRKAAASHPNATSEHLDKALNDKSDRVRREAALNKNATSEHIDKALNDDHSYVRQAAAGNGNASKENLDKAITDGDKYVREIAVNNKKATPEHKAKSDQYEEDVKKRIAAASDPNASEKDLDNGLKDKDIEVRKAVANHPNATLEQYKTALNDKNSQVSSAAERNKHFHKLIYNMTLPIKESMHRAKRIQIIKECVKIYV